MIQRVAVRGLARLASRIFFVWGALAAAKGLWDAFGGQPEANYFSPQPWQFVTRQEWSRYAGFELAYGLACLGVGWAILSLARRLPLWKQRENEIDEIL